MKFLGSDILPVGLSEHQQSIIDCFREQASHSERIEVAVGYISKASLLELDAMVQEYGIQRITLVIGMYFIEGMPEGSYHVACEINDKWQAQGIGEIRLVKAVKYHGKTYCFYRNDLPFSAIVGSANLGVLKLEASNRRQYEAAMLVDSPSDTLGVHYLIEKLKANNCSANIRQITGMALIREVNTSLNNIENVTHVPQTEYDLYSHDKTDISFVLPLKVPCFAERLIDDGKHFTKSNLNVCYAAPRYARKSRDWYETQLTVSKEITRMPGYPEKNKPFFVITDDGYWSKVHTTSDGNKQFSAVGNELIMGRWIKGRLAAAGLVTPVNNTGVDTERKGMITQEMLAEYGCDRLVLTKTTRKAADENGEELDVWLFSFEAGA